jgi:hypothetical protein
MKILVGVLITLCLLVCIHQAHAETTTINQKGMPSLIAKVTSFLDLCLAVVSQMMTLCRTIIAVGIDRMTLIAQYIKFQCVALKSNIERLVAQLINQVPLMKLGLMNVLHNLGQGGQHLLTTVRQILQRVYKALKRGN